MSDFDERLEESVFGAFPFLRTGDPALRRDFFDAAAKVTIPPGQFICMEGDQCGQLPLVMSGRARVYKSGEQGREITLYRLETGESCILTAACIASAHAFPAFAVTETEVEALVIPAPSFHAWLTRHEAWRAYVFELLWKRLANVIAVVEEVTFRRMDARIAGYLVERSEASNGVIETTHESIADELGTAREVVSRILKDFEHDDRVSLSRGAIRITDLDALQSIALRV